MSGGCKITKNEAGYTPPAAPASGAPAAGAGAAASGGEDKQKADAAMRAMKFAAENPHAVQNAANLANQAQEGTKKAGGSNVIAGAAAAGAAAGVATGVFLIGAPVMLGMAGAAGAAYLATTDGKNGDAARSVGRGTVEAYEGAKKTNREHQITDKAKAAGTGVAQKAKALDEEHKIIEKTTAAAKGVYEKALSFNQKNDVTGKVSRGMLAGFNSLTGALAKPAAPAAGAAGAAAGGGAAAGAAAGGGAAGPPPPPPDEPPK